jgi:diaminopimelate decarboxylase
MFEIKGHDLYVEQIKATDLAAQYGTPLYVLSEASLRKNLGDIKANFMDQYEDVHAAYASKALLTSAVVRIVAQEGFHLDVVSGGELYTAIHASFPMSKIIFHGNNKSDEELQMALDNGVGRIVVDNVGELHRLAAMAEKAGKKAKILFRITPGIKAGTHHYISTGQKDSKFGIALDESIIFPAIEFAIQNESIDFLGFHFHIGSQLFINDTHIAATKVAISLIKAVKDRYQYEIRELNTGGGYGIKYVEGDTPKPASYFTDAIMAALESLCETEGLVRPTIFIEPGRSIVGEAGITLYKAGAVKTIPNIRTYVAVDGGMTDNIRPALYQAKYEAIVAGRADAPSDEVVTLCGKCCESGDILIEHIPMQHIETGDILAVFSTGAYTYAMASHYNKHPNPAIVLVSGDQSYEIVKRETYEDLVSKDVIPAHLKA